VTSITNANPDPDNTNIPTGVTPFGQFKFTAASNENSLNGLNKWVLSGVIFNINATQVAMNSSGFNIYNKNDSTQKVACGAYYSNATEKKITAGSSHASGAFLVQCKGLVGSIVDTTVDPGASVTLVLEGDVNNAKIGTVTSSLQASIQEFTSPNRNNFGVHATQRNQLTWNDTDTTTTTFYWVEYPETVVNSTSYKS